MQNKSIQDHFDSVKLAIKENGKLKHLRCQNCGEIYDIVMGKKGIFLSCKNWKNDEKCKKGKNVICTDKKYLET